MNKEKISVNFEKIKKENKDYFNKEKSIVRNQDEWEELINSILFPKRFPKNLPGSFWGLTTFFNPAGYRNKYENYRIFRENSKKQGLKLLAVELAFGNKPFELKKEDAEILIQIRGNKNNIMWQKERMLNIGLERLPKDCDKIAWLDADVIFKNDNWVNETSKLLEKYAIIQPFSISYRLEKDKSKIEEFEMSERGLDEGKKMEGIGYLISKNGRKLLEKGFMKHGQTGYAWAARKEILDKIKFYDKSITGSGDLIMAHGFFGAEYDYHSENICEELIKNIKKWQKNASLEVNNSIFYTEGMLVHLWHGDLINRGYRERHKILDNFNPERDLEKDSNGLWKLNNESYKKIKEYFKTRKEEGTIKDKLKKIIFTLKNKYSTNKK